MVHFMLLVASSDRPLVRHKLCDNTYLAVHGEIYRSCPIRWPFLTALHLYAARLI